MFDASNRQACRVRLATTSTPLHALTTLNDPTWVEAARVLAGHCMQAEATVDQRLIAAFSQVVCRPPDARDLDRLRTAYEKQYEFYRNDASSAKELLQVGSAPTDESNDVSEQAALTAVCLAIFNLDEALTRE